MSSPWPLACLLLPRDWPGAAPWPADGDWPPALLAGHDDLVDLVGKPQIKAGSRVAVVAAGPDAPDLPGLREAVTDPLAADAVIAFARCSADLAGPALAAIDAQAGQAGLDRLPEGGAAGY